MAAGLMVELVGRRIRAKKWLRFEGAAGET
jgi:hypothetical protein